MKWCRKSTFCTACHRQCSMPPHTDNRTHINCDSHCIPELTNWQKLALGQKKREIYLALTFWGHFPPSCRLGNPGGSRLQLQSSKKMWQICHKRKTISPARNAKRPAVKVGPGCRRVVGWWRAKRGRLRIRTAKDVKPVG